MIAEISPLPEVPEWPNRRLPQDRFDTRVREAMLSMHRLTTALNGEFRPAVNAVLPYLEVILEHLDAIRRAADNARRALEGAARAEAAQQAAEEAREAAWTSAEEARLRARGAAADALLAASHVRRTEAAALRAEQAAGEAAGYALTLDAVRLRLATDASLARMALASILQTRRMQARRP